MVYASHECRSEWAADGGITAFILWAATPPLALGGFESYQPTGCDLRVMSLL